jgi:methylated-DNA-[protein]-cysteine S-methyltransferase
VAPLAVTVDDGAVVSIELNTRCERRPRTAVERQVAKELREYATGTRTAFTFRTAPTGSAFDHAVWDAVAAIPYGATATYGEIARRIGNPAAARAVGAANGRNPVPLVIPCHRVVATGGKLGGYGGGLPLKRRLLSLEGRATPTRLALLALTLVTLVSAASCADPTRPRFVPDPSAVDTFPPTITFLEPPPDDTILSVGQDVLVQVRVSDTSPIQSIAAGVLGVFTFSYPSIFPDDTVAVTGYQIAVPPVVPAGQIVLRIVATDTLFNRSSADRAFVIQ